MRRALLLAILHTGCGPGFLDPILTTGIDPSSPGEATTFATDGLPETPSGASISSASGSSPGPDLTTLSSGVPDDCTFVCTATTDDGSFIVPPDPPAACDVWAQDCPPGEKCTAAGPPPLEADSIVCAPIVSDPDQLGEPCQMLAEGYLGPDTCDLGLYCHDIDPFSHKGTCIPLCTGDFAAPSCPIGQACLKHDLPLCLPACDPLLDLCPAGDTCLWLGHEFGCWPAGEQPKKGLFEVCEYADPCEDGQICTNTMTAAECDQDGVACCIPFCDLDAPACPGFGRACETFYPDTPPPPGLEHLGVCTLP